MQNRNNKQKGFTIIETMISVSLFIVVVMAGMGALLNANLLQQKSQDMRSIMDNLSFTMEDMSRNLRTGYNYRCFFYGDLITQTTVSMSPVTKSCPPGGSINGGGIAFENQDGVADDPKTPVNENTDDQWVYYIGPCNGGKSGICKSVDGGASFVQLVPDEVDIDSVSSFSVLGAEAPTRILTPSPHYDCGSSYDCQQPFVTIKLVGTITYKSGTSNSVTTPFSLQTSVSQRNIDR